ncbi:MAG: thiamine pyrophosphate-dependent enzyme [Pseudomonadota bacterium]|nr:thiamine pyrophosphate-dependent enzyme [Pseudomonadota bacterium]
MSDNDNLNYDTDFKSEIPVNLPANRIETEWGSDVIVDMLARMGCDYLMLTPGSSFRGLHDSLINYGRNHKPELLLCAHEEIAVSMAHGYAKATGKIGMVALHDLVGVQHALMSFYNAWADRQPLLVIGGGGPMAPDDRRAIDWIHSANAQSEMVRPYSKWSDDPTTLQSILDSFLRAQRIAMNAPAGPTYVTIDTGLQEMRVEDGDYALPDPSLPRYQPAPPVAASADSISAAAEILCESEFPVIFGGRIGLRVGATEPMRELVEQLGAAYQEAGDVNCMPSAHPQNMNGGYAATRETEIRGMADAILAVDCADVAGATGGYDKARGGGYAVGGETKQAPKIIDLSLNDFRTEHWSNIGGAVSPTDVQLLAEPMHGLNQLLDEVRRRAEGEPEWRKRAIERTSKIAAMHETLRARQRAEFERLHDQVPIAPARMIEELWNEMKNRDYLLLLRNGRSWYEGMWEFKESGQFLGSNGGGGVGSGPGGVVGAALAARDRGKFPICIMGDGDFTMGPAALWTAVHYKIPLMLVIHNNNSFGNDEEHQISLAEQRDRPVENAWIGQRMSGPSPDYAAIAEGYGAQGIGPITEPGEVGGAFKRAASLVESGGVVVVDVRTQLK